MKQLFNKLFDVIKNLLIESRKSVKNFIIFALIFTIINFLLRSTIINLLSPELINKNIYLGLSIILIGSMFFSILLFYIRFHYSAKIKSFFSRFIDFELRAENNRRWQYLEEEAQKKFPEVWFGTKWLFIPITILFILSGRSLGTPWQPVISAWLTILCLFTLFCMRRMKMAVAMTDVPLEKLPVPPKIYNLWWDFRFAMGKWALGFLFGSNGQTAQQLTEEQLRYKVLQNKNRYWITATAGIFVGAIIGVATFWDHTYTPTGSFSSFAMYAQVAHRDYYTSSQSVAQKAWELEAWGGDMQTFCYPGTRRLDDRAIQDTYDYIEHKREERWRTGESVPRPIGPYAEHKEFDDLTQDSNIIAEKKENDDLR